MTPQGFVKAFSTMESLVRKLEEAGIVQRNAEKEETKRNDLSVSPNFQ